MRIAVYEFLTAGGWQEAEPPPASLLQEGRAMVTALVDDLSRCEDIATTLLWSAASSHAAPPAKCDVQPVAAGQERSALMAAAKHADWTIVIAPEFDGLLRERAAWVVEAGGRLLGPSLLAIEQAADKQATCEAWREAGLPVPGGIALAAGERLPVDFPYPAVLKPRDGAGSWKTRRVTRPGPDAAEVVDRAMRLERFCPGVPASVAWLCGPAGRFPLLPCTQQLTEDGSFNYLGGTLPLAWRLAERARRLSAAALEVTPGLLGYVGIDLILGHASDGGDDYLVELNPRLTTSYVGLRQAAQGNLAEILLQLAQGADPAEMEAKCDWRKEQAWRFFADGRVQTLRSEAASNLTARE